MLTKMFGAIALMACFAVATQADEEFVEPNRKNIVRYVQVDTLRPVPNPHCENSIPPQAEYGLVKVTFFNVGRVLSDHALDNEYAIRGLAPVSPFTLIAFNKMHSAFRFDHPNKTVWKDEFGIRSASWTEPWSLRFAFLEPSDTLRNADWWFAGVARKPVETAITCSIFPIWKTIKLGTLDDVKDLRAAMEGASIYIHDYARSMLDHQMFSLAPVETKVELVKISVAELGFPNGAIRAEIFAAAQTMGLFLCPAEVGPQLCLQYADQPKGEWLLIGMEPIPAFDGNPSVFSFGRNGGGRWLYCGWVKPGHVWGAVNQWVFCRSKK